MKITVATLLFSLFTFTGCVSDDPDDSWWGEPCLSSVAVCGDGACVPDPTSTDPRDGQCWPACDPIAYGPGGCADGLTPYIYRGAPGVAGFCACVINETTAPAIECTTCEFGWTCDVNVGWRCWGGTQDVCVPHPNDPACPGN